MFRLTYRKVYDILSLVSIVYLIKWLLRAAIQEERNKIPPAKMTIRLIHSINRSYQAQAVINARGHHTKYRNLLHGAHWKKITTFTNFRLLTNFPAYITHVLVSIIPPRWLINRFYKKTKKKNNANKTSYIINCWVWTYIVKWTLSNFEFTNSTSLMSIHCYTCCLIFLKDK